MVATGYSLSLVGKYGVKSIFQSIKHFVQNVCDEFCQGYVVARVRAAREETAGGPFMDVALTEQTQTLQDLNFRHLLCAFETTEEEGEKIPAQNAFTVQKSQFCQKCHDTLALNRRYEMFNKLNQK